MAEKEVKFKVVAETEMSNLENLKTTVEETESSVDSLNNSFQDIDTSNVEQLGTDLDNDKASADDLSNGLSSIDDSGITNASNDAGDLGQNLDNARESSDELGNSLSTIEAVSFMGLAEGIGQYADGAENLAQNMNEASITVGQLATQTGIAEPKMVALINEISNATFPNEEAMMYVKSLDQIGVSAENLGKSATDLDKINDAFGLGASTVNSLGQELSVLGVDMNNVSSSFNALAYANSNTVGGMQNYYSFLRKYDAQFKELGFNVDQASVIIAGATQKFGGGRAALSGLSNALKEADGDTRKLEEALGLESGALEHASDLTGQYEGQLQTLADEEAEHKTILDQINAAWEDMSLLLSPILSPLGSVIGMIGQVGQFALAVNSIKTLMESFGGLTSVLSRVGGAFSSLFSILLANPIILVVVAIAALIAILLYLYYTNEDFRNFVDGLLGGFGEICSVIYNDVIGAFTWLTATWQSVVDFFQTYGQLFVEIFFIMATGGIGAIILLIANMNGVPTQIGSILNNALNYVIQFATGLVSRFINAGKNSVNGFLDYIRQLPGKFLDELNKMIWYAIDFATRLPQIIASAAGNMVLSWVVGSGEHSPGFMYDAFTGELNEMEDASRNVMIAENIGQVSKRMVELFGEPSFKQGNFEDNNTSFLDKLTKVLSSILNSTDNATYNFNLYGDIDNEDRMRKFIEAVRRELFWNNQTAGRDTSKYGV